MVSATVRETTLAGWRALVLENEHLALTVLPERGAEIHALLDRATGIDALLHAPWGLRPPGSPPADSAFEFLHNYEGSWQELFPNTLDACIVDGVEHPFHGELALRPWDEIEVSGERLTLAAQTRGGLCLTRTMRLDGDAPRLVIEEQVEHRGDRPEAFAWGHHCVLGPPFLEPGCRIHAPATDVLVLPADTRPPNARVAGGQRTRWPLVAASAGGQIDLGELPGPGCETDDDVFLTGFAEGLIAVESPRLGRTFELRWDVETFPWLTLWQPFGGAAAPLAGVYGLGIEPWTSPGNLAHALAAGEAHELAPGERRETALTASYR